MTSTTIDRILDEVGPTAFPGVFDTLSAKIAQSVGFPLAFISGYQCRRHVDRRAGYGPADADRDGDRAEHICRSVEDPHHRRRGHRLRQSAERLPHGHQLIAGGAAGCFLEDQVWPKKCGHMRGKQVIAREDYVHKIRAAVDARQDRDFFIVARTDALAVAGMDEAVARVQAGTRSRRRRQLRRGSGQRRTAGGNRPPLARPQCGQHDRRR